MGKRWCRSESGAGGGDVKEGEEEYGAGGGDVKEGEGEESGKSISFLRNVLTSEGDVSAPSL